MLAAGLSITRSSKGSGKRDAPVITTTTFTNISGSSIRKYHVQLGQWKQGKICRCEHYKQMGCNCIIVRFICYQFQCLNLSSGGKGFIIKQNKMGDKRRMSKRRGVIGICWTQKVIGREGACKTELHNCRLVKLQRHDI